MLGSATKLAVYETRRGGVCPPDLPRPLGPVPFSHIYLSIYPMSIFFLITQGLYYV